MFHSNLVSLVCKINTSAVDTNQRGYYKVQVSGPLNVHKSDWSATRDLKGTKKAHNQSSTPSRCHYAKALSLIKMKKKSRFFFCNQSKFSIFEESIVGENQSLNFRRNFIFQNETTKHDVVNHNRQRCKHAKCLLYLWVHLYICIDAYLDLEPNMVESRQNW